MFQSFFKWFPRLEKDKNHIAKDPNISKTRLLQALMVTSHSPPLSLPCLHQNFPLFGCGCFVVVSGTRARAQSPLPSLRRFWQLLSPALGRSVAARSDLGRSQRGGGGRDGAGEQYTRWWNWWNGGETFPRRRRFLQTYFGSKWNREEQRIR